MRDGQQKSIGENASLRFYIRAGPSDPRVLHSESAARLAEAASLGFTKTIPE